MSGGSSLIGSGVQRKEDPRLLTGRGTFVADVRMPGLLEAAFVRSLIARGRIVSVDVAEARALPGVVAILTADDLNSETGSLRLADMGMGGSRPPIFPLAHDHARFVGEPIALVVAESRHVAEDACQLVYVDYEPEDAVVDRLDALEDKALVHPELDTNLASELGGPPSEDLQEVFARADLVIRETFTQARQTNAPLETRGIVATWDRATGALTTWLSTQNVHIARSWLADALALPEHRVRVVMGDVGGGFGQKIFVNRDELSVVLAARAVGRPIRWIEDRWENLTASNHAREEHVEVTVAAANDGTILGLHVDHVENVGAVPLSPIETTGVLMGMMLPGPYRIPRSEYRVRTVYTNTCGRGAYRGPWLIETTIRETIVDRVARALGLDPLEVRRRNALGSDDLPYTSAAGMVYENITPAESLSRLGERLHEEGIPGYLAEARAAGRTVGVGLSLFVEPTGGYGGPYSTEAATVRMDPSGAVTVLTGLGSHGHGTETTLAQIVADRLGVSLDSVTVLQGDTALIPYGAGTAGSRSAVAGGGAALLAGDRLRAKILEIAAYELEAAPDDLEVTDGRISVRGSPNRETSVAAVAVTAYFNPGALPPGAEPGLEMTARHAVPLTFANAAHACLVEIDPTTGETEVLRYFVVEDCGVIINPMIVDGQITGGVAQGIGAALFEHFVYDEDGNPLTTTLLDYRLPLATDIPALDITHLETPSGTPGGYKGVGEGGTIGAPAAVINAIVDALSAHGVDWIAHQPVTPQIILAALDAS